MTSIRNLDCLQSVSVANFDTQFCDVSTFNHLRSLLFGSSNLTVLYNWSPDGLNVDYIDTYNTTAGVSQSISLPVRARYLYIRISPAVTPSTVRVQSFFFEDSTSLANLVNLGTGAQLYNVAQQGVKSVRSSDATVTISGSSTEIDLKVVPPSTTTLTSTGGTSLVSDGTGPTLSVKGLTSSVQGDDIKIVDSGSSLDIQVGNKGTDAVVINRVAGSQGTNTVVIGKSASSSASSGVAIGLSSSVTSSQGIAIGVSATASTDGVSLGYQANTSVNSVAIGRNAKAKDWRCISIGDDSGNNSTGQRSICIGYRSGANGPVATSEVCIGDDCRSTNVAGRFSLGHNMEAIQPSATTGASGAPPAQVYGYMRISHNGQLLKIPLYND